MSGQMTLEVADSSFGRFWGLRGEWVEQPNQRRGGESGVQRVWADNGQLLYVKRQAGHVYRSWRYPLGRPTVLREQDALEGLRGLGVSVPNIVFCGAERDEQGQWRALLVTEALSGFEEIDHWYASGGRERYGEQVHDRLLQALAESLARMHRGRWQHSCLYSKHVFVKVTGEGEQAEVHVALRHVGYANHEREHHGVCDVRADYNGRRYGIEEQQYDGHNAPRADGGEPDQVAA